MGQAIAANRKFNEDQRREAGLGSGQLIVDRYGFAADLSWHAPPRKGDARNHHCHILFTTRGLNAAIPHVPDILMTFLLSQDRRT